MSTSGIELKICTLPPSRKEVGALGCSPRAAATYALSVAFCFSNIVDIYFSNLILCVCCFFTFFGSDEGFRCQNANNELLLKEQKYVVWTVPLLGMYPKELKVGTWAGNLLVPPCSQQHYSQPQKGGNNQCPLTDGWIGKNVTNT